MRTVHHFVVAVAAVLAFVVGVKTIAPQTGAQAYAAAAAGLNVLQMQAEAKALPELKMHDMTFALDRSSRGVAPKRRMPGNNTTTGNPGAV
ncbi:MAG TPA: hypothetical protein VMH84_18030 [Xanthobacteraceae bacterium]|nr:hypothetical protein [Xanthobacteraceae bacterium]